MGARTNSLNHERLWAAIDAIAEHNGLSPSALARRAGLNSTAFNKSKRVTADGRPRWPSTESIAKILEATGAGLDDLVRLIAGAGDAASTHRLCVPFVAAGGALPPGFSEEGAAPASGVRFPDLGDEALFAYEIAEGEATTPYRPGDVVIASTSAEVRKGDRVLVASFDGRITARTFLGRNARSTEFAGASHEAPTPRQSTAEVLWMARILWASQ